jgi:hypothetical protein
MFIYRKTYNIDQRYPYDSCARRLRHTNFAQLLFIVQSGYMHVRGPVHVICVRV